MSDSQAIAERHGSFNWMFAHRFFEDNEHDWKVGDDETCEPRTEDGENQSGVVTDRDQETQTVSGLIVKFVRIGRNQA
jgi:hypothetical protein